ncbi:E2 [Fulmarus glacialis papillomavirus 1]|uniref:Protein E8^E2C n=1 Tax=Fulmarus glacialis papillomavirus 1 TaxID=1463817 RepID=A0A059TAV9_9PAPI|nr:E2 [Fulmarus glacialis papillomavirus 1]AHV82119.1 E2 [Fulmarus glacialis papillomavirus 1]
MEQIHQTLQTVQKEILKLLEEAPSCLSGIRAYWQNIKKEQLLLHAVRHKYRVTTLGYIPVPSLAETEHKAKEAIKVLLILEGLQRSGVSDDGWTLSDFCPLILLQTDPKDYPKRKGVSVTVQFGNDKDNVNDYTIWKDLWVPDEDGTYFNVSGHVDHDGCYYMSAGEKRYYLCFREEWSKFRTEKDCEPQWTVGGLQETPRNRPIKKRTRFCPWDGDGRIASEDEEGPSTSKQARLETEIAKAKQQKPEDDRDSAPVLSPQTSSPRHIVLPCGTPPYTKPVGRVNPSSLSPSPPPLTPQGTPTRPIQAASPQQHLQQQRLRQLLLQHQSLVPCVLIEGTAEQVKAIRFRIRHHGGYGHTRVSTTWHWTQDARKVSPCRILIRFETDGERTNFINGFKICSDVKLTRCTFEGL